MGKTFKKGRNEEDDESLSSHDEYLEKKRMKHVDRALRTKNIDDLIAIEDSF